MTLSPARPDVCEVARLEGQPLYLSGVGCEWTARLEAEKARIGLLLQPDSHLEDKVKKYRYFGVDNGCFAKGDRFDAEAWIDWVATIPPERCLFVVAPDVICNAKATWKRSLPWFDRIRELGHRPALVGQNGAESMEVIFDEAWRFDAIFIGGDNEWKESDRAAEVVHRFQELGKWAHVGRVNSFRRYSLMASHGVDSVDGTFLKFGPIKNGPRLAGWLERLAKTPVEQCQCPTSRSLVA